MKKNLLIVLFMVAIASSSAQTKTGWNGKKCAIAITYDDALNVDLDNAIPVLDSLGLKATFYLSGYSRVVNNRIPEWVAIARNGHELGNHTLYHPCIGKRPGREFVTADYDLSNYSIRRITDEVRMTNTLLKAIDGKTKRTFAYPCGDTKIGDSSYIDPLKNDFVGARGVSGYMPTIDKVDVYNLPCYTINGQSGQELIELVKKAMNGNALLVFLFHGVGGEHSLNVSLPAHRELLRFIKQNQKDIWVAPMIEITEYVRKERNLK